MSTYEPPMEEPGQLPTMKEVNDALDAARLGNHHTIFADTCPECGGDGGFESMPTGYSHINGQPTTHWIECRACKGGGEIETEYECRTLEDLEREAEEDNQLAAGTHYLDVNGSLQPKPTT